MANTFGTDILIQAPDPAAAAAFYVEQLGFEITGEDPQMISLHGRHINLFIERGPALGPVFEVTVDSVEAAKQRLVARGQLVKHGRTKIFSQIAGMKDFSNLIVGTKNMPDLRVIAPGHGIENNVFPSTYLDDAILAAWQHFTSHNLTVTTGYGTATGRVQGSSASPMIFTRNGGTVATIDLPTTLQTFECSGPLAQGNNEAGAIGDVLAAALNRSLLPKYVNQPYCEKGKFYQASATNSYSKTMHANTKDYNCYGFAFDDQCGYSSDIGAADMTELTVTLQSFT